MYLNGLNQVRMSLENTEKCVSFCLAVLLSAGLFVPVAEAQAGQQELEKAINELRKLYQDTYPEFQNIEVMREGGESNRAEEKARDLKEEISSRLEDINRLLDGIQTDNRPVQRKVGQVKTLFDLFVRYQRKFLSEWEPENPQLFEAFNRRELISRGLASPKMLRQTFLSDLTGMIHTTAYVRENVLKSNLNQYALQVQNTYRDLLERFLRLLNRIEQAQNNEEKDIEEAIQNVRDDWNAFWQGIKDEQGALRNGINRVLSMYRGQNQEYMPTNQKRTYDKGIRIKRDFNEIMRFQRTVSQNEVFSSPEAVRDLLIMLGKRFSKRLTSMLREQKADYMAMFQKFLQNKQQLERLETEKSYTKRRSQIDRWLDGVYGEFNLEGSLDRIRNVPQEALSILARELRSNYGDNEKKLASTLEGLGTFAQDFMEFSERARSVTQAYADRFKQVSFESPEQFQKVFPGPVEEKVNAVNQQRRELNEQFRTLDEQVDQVLDLNFQLAKEDGDTTG